MARPCHTWRTGHGAHAGLLGLFALTRFGTGLPVPRLYVWAFLLFMAWAVTTSIWAPGGGPPVHFDPTTGSMAIDSGAIRVAMAAVLGPLALWGMAGAVEHRDRAAWLGMAMRFAIGLQALALLVITLFPDAIAAAVASISGPGEIGQNFIRNVNLGCLILPLVIVLGFRRGASVGLLAGGAFGALLLYASVRLDSQAASIAVIAALAGTAFGAMAGRRGFLVLGLLSAALLAAMPLIIGGVLQLSSASEPGALPLSVTSRLESYAYVMERIEARPWLGWGLEASKGWKDTFGADAGILAGYRLVPGHPHNMGLQLWAETGLAGVVLLVLALIVFSLRLATAKAMTHRQAAFGCGLWGAAMPFVLFSYSLWNEAFWCAIAFVAACVFLPPRKSVRL